MFLGVDLCAIIVYGVNQEAGDRPPQDTKGKTMIFKSEKGQDQIEARKAFAKAYERKFGKEHGLSMSNLGAYPDENKLRYIVGEKRSRFQHGQPPIYFAVVDGHHIFYA